MMVIPINHVNLFKNYIKGNPQVSLIFVPSEWIKLMVQLISKNMKTKFAGILIFLLTVTTIAFAGEKTEKFDVKGNCGMCEKRIEKAALSVEGVSKADWNKESKQVELTFNDEKTSVGKVQKAIAEAGHDTKMHKAENEVYNKLPACCKYDRTEAQTKMQGHEGHDH